MTDVANYFIWKNLFWGTKYFCTINRNGKMNLEKASDLNTSYKKFQSKWKEWEHLLIQEDSNCDHTIPTFPIVDRIKITISLLILQCCLIFFIVAVTLKDVLVTGVTEQSLINDSPFFLSLIGVTMGIEIIGLCFFISRSYYKLSLANGFIRINFLKGHIIELPLLEICDYNFGVLTRNAFLKFKNGTKLVHLERVSYWPILREKLLEKLEPDRENS